MANDPTKLISYENLSAYDTLIKAWSNSGSQFAYKTVIKSADGNSLLFYKKPNAVEGTDTADATISLGNSDMQTQLNALASICGAVWDSTNKTYSLPLDNTFGANTDTVVEALNELKGQINILNGNDSTAGSVAKSIKDAVEGLDVTEFPLAEVNSNVVTIHGISETDGKIAVGANSANNIVFEEVAYTGAAADVSYDNTTSEMTSTTVQAAIDELAEASASGVESKTVYITETAGGAGDAYSKRYGIYQGSTGSSASPEVTEKLADIDIPKDMVVEDGSVVDVVFVEADNSLHEGSASGTDVTAEIKGSETATSADAGKYIKLTIANATSSHLWIKATDLVDIYTAQQNATQIQLAIDSSNVISATVVAGSIGTTELANSAITTAKIADSNVTTAKIADDAVTADKVAISAHTESADQTGRTDGLSVSVTTTDGQVSSVTAAIAAGTYYDTTNYVMATSQDINNLFQ